MCRNVLLSIVGIAFAVLQVHSQVLPDMTLSSDFEAEVKSLDEFRARFNGDETKPGIEHDAYSRRNNLISLFDFDMDKGCLTPEQFSDKMEDFLDSVLLNDCQFEITEAGLWAQCLCRVKYFGKDKRLTLYLQSEKYREDMYRWAIASVTGLEEAGIIGSEKYYAISPVAHEVHFMGLQDMLNENPTHAFGYRYKGARIDGLSVFLALVQVGILKFDIVEEQTFLYFDIPGYIISINEIVREGQNSGWLITSFEQVSESEKLTRINKILGYE